MALDLPAVASLASVTAVVLPLGRLARRQVGSGTALTPALAAFTLFWFVMLVLIELLSLVSLLGSRVAWTGMLVALAAALEVADARACAGKPRDAALDVPPLAHALKEPWSLIVGPVVLVLAILFAQSAYLTAFTGINHTDGQWHYMARSIQYLRDGTVWKYSTANDMLPRFHQTISAYALLFYGSEAAILLLSILFGAVACVAVFDLSRLAGAPVSLALLAGLSPLSVPIFSLHLGTSNFDVHTALSIVLSIYFLALAIRTGQSRYLLAAACATSLASATKVRFWFAAPGLGLLWLAAAVALARRSGLHSLVRPLALATLSCWRPDVILLDLMMPIMDGWTFLTTQQSSQRLRRIPVILMSASHTLTRGDERLAVADVVAKPFEIDTVLTKVAALAHRADAPAQSLAS